jgi:hypothetical protein
VGILWDLLLLYGLLLDGLLDGLWCLVILNRVERCGCFLFLQRAECGHSVGLRTLWPVESRCKWIIGPRCLRFDSVLRLMCPWVIAARLHSVLLLQRLLTEAILLPIWVVRVERSLLRLHEILLRLLLLTIRKPCVLSLLLITTITISIWIASLLWLHAKSRILLLLWVNHISKPVHTWLLLVALIPAGWLGNCGLSGCVVEKQVGICLFKFSSPEVLLLFAQFKGLCKVGIDFLGFASLPSTPRIICFSLGPASFNCSAEFIVVIVITARLSARSRGVLGRAGFVQARNS